MTEHNTPPSGSQTKLPAHGEMMMQKMMMMMMMDVRSFFFVDGCVWVRSVLGVMTKG